MNYSIEEGRTEDKIQICIHTYVFWIFYFFKGVQENIILSSNEAVIAKLEGRLRVFLYSNFPNPRSVFKYLQLLLVPLLLSVLQSFTWFVSLHWWENLLSAKQQFCCFFVTTPSIINLPLVIMCAALVSLSCSTMSCIPSCLHCSPWAGEQGLGPALVALLLHHVWAAARFDLSWQQLMPANTDGIYFHCPHSSQRAVQAFNFLLVEFKHLNIILDYSCWSYTSVYKA